MNAQPPACLTQFVRLEVPWVADPRAMEGAIALALQVYGEPLRWAITAVDEARGIAVLEAVVTLSPEAVPQGV